MESCTGLCVILLLLDSLLSIYRYVLISSYISHLTECHVIVNFGWCMTCTTINRKRISILFSCCETRVVYWWFSASVYLTQPLVSNSFSYLWTIYMTYMASLEKAETASWSSSVGHPRFIWTNKSIEFIWKLRCGKQSNRLGVCRKFWSHTMAILVLLLLIKTLGWNFFIFNVIFLILYCLFLIWMDQFIEQQKLY